VLPVSALELFDGSTVCRPVECAEERVGNVERVEHRGVHTKLRQPAACSVVRLRCCISAISRFSPTASKVLERRHSSGSRLRSDGRQLKNPKPGGQLLGPEFFEFALPEGQFEVPELSQQLPESALCCLEGLGQAVASHRRCMRSSSPKGASGVTKGRKEVDAARFGLGGFGSGFPQACL